MARPLLLALMSVMFLGVVTVLWSYEQQFEQPFFLQRSRDNEATSARQTISPSRGSELMLNAGNRYDPRNGVHSDTSTHVNKIGPRSSAVGKAHPGGDVVSDASTGTTALRRASISPSIIQTEAQWYTGMNVGWAARFQGYKVGRDIRKASERPWAYQAMVVVFDSRWPEPPNASSERLPTYWWGSAYVWASYAQMHGHGFVFYTRSICAGCDGRPLHPAWCKVAALLQAYADYPRVEMFLYVDSDSTISKAHFNTTLLEVAQDLAFLPEDSRPILLNQDGPGSWCQQNAMYLKPGAKAFEHCLNSGALLIRRHADSQAFLEAWWAHADLPRESSDNSFDYDARLVWPYEQGPMAAVKERFRDSVMVVPHPQRHFMNWPYRPSSNNGLRGLPIMPYCFSHGKLYPVSC